MNLALSCPDYFFMNWSILLASTTSTPVSTLQSSFPQSATAVTASKAISFRQFENGLRNLIVEKPIVDTRRMEFPDL